MKRPLKRDKRAILMAKGPDLRLLRPEKEVRGAVEMR